MNQPRSHSTARDPFSTYREYALSLTIDETVLDDTPWESPACEEFFVFWEDFPPIVGKKYFGLAEALAKLYANSGAPLATVLVSAAVNMHRFQEQVRAAPTADELADQLSSLKRQLNGLASLAQGGKSTGKATPDPSWLRLATEADKSFLIESSLSETIGRTSALHPMLQDILFKELAKDIPFDVDVLARSVNNARLKKEQDSLLSFFSMIGKIRDLIETAEEACRRDESLPHIRKRLPGAPADEAKDWLMVRLLWIWRDVLGQEIKVYARKIEKGVELDQPKPNGCMDFVISVMRHVEPVRPHQIQALERKLTELKDQVPQDRLAIRRV